MLEIKSKLKIARSAYKLEVKDQLKLPFELRQKSRQRLNLASGEEVAVNLPRGDMMRGGDLLVGSDGRIIEVIAEHEALIQVECANPKAFALAAWHLGSRHVAIQIGENWLRAPADHLLEPMLKRLGFKTHAITEAFDPEPGAHGGHDHGEGQIHEYGDHGRDHHGHDHDDHGDHHGHDHGHGHGHGHDH